MEYHMNENPSEAKRIGITETALRDGHQSLLATRMRTEHMIPIAEKMDEVGYHSLEVWGGATFDSCLRFLNECPWERLRELRKRFKRTKLQMLLRGQNLVGYRHYPDDVVEEFVKRAVANGIDILRIFDALNDVRNMEKAMEAGKREGAYVQATVCYTISPLHTIEHFVETATKLKEMGADSICVKDMAGILSPPVAFELVARLKAVVGLPVQLHCHYTSGMAAMSYLKGIEAGADVIDTAISPLALGTSQPATETMVAVLRETPYDTGLDIGILSEIADYFAEVRKRYKDFDVGSGNVDVNVLIYQIPGGMISNFVSQLQEQRALNKLKDVLAEVPRVRADMGYPPLVTPSSQIVGTQAVLNVLLGRYNVVADEVKEYFRGSYGRPPGPVNPEIQKKCIGDEKPIAGRPADLMEPMLEKARQEIQSYIEKEEDVLSYCLFPDVALSFFKNRKKTT